MSLKLRHLSGQRALKWNVPNAAMC